MKRLNANDSIYLVSDDDITHFTQIVKDYPHYSVLLRKNAGGLVFLWRLTFDIYYYLDRPSEKIFIDFYKLLDNPLTSYIQQLLTRNEQLKNFKLVYNPDQGLKLLLSILLTKQILRHVNLASMYEESDFELMDVYRLEESGDLTNDSTKTYFDKNYEKQKQVIAKLRESLIEENHFDKIIQSTIEEAKRMHNFILYTEVS